MCERSEIGNLIVFSNEQPSNEQSVLSQLSLSPSYIIQKVDKHLGLFVDTLFESTDLLVCACTNIVPSHR